MDKAELRLAWHLAKQLVYTYGAQIKKNECISENDIQHFSKIYSKREAYLDCIAI